MTETEPKGLIARLDEAAARLADLGEAPPLAIICGSGYKFLEADMAGEVKGLGYDDIPHLQACTNSAHAGRLIVGELMGVRAAVLLGRLHRYEGYPMEDVVFPVRLLARWGVPTFMLTNAAGGVNTAYQVGDLMALSDHINMLGANPLTGPNLKALGTRFPDMTEAYDRPLLQAAVKGAEAAGFTLHRGVYVATPGPSYETPAEIRAFRTMGADAVGMSTVPETIALRHMGRRVFGLSCITNAAAGLNESPLNDDEVRDVMERDDVRRRVRAVVAAVTAAIAGEGA